MSLQNPRHCSGRTQFNYSNKLCPAQDYWIANPDTMPKDAAIADRVSWHFCNGVRWNGSSRIRLCGRSRPEYEGNI